MPSFSISLLAFLLLAACASAKTLQDVCKGTVDPNFCNTMLKKTVSPSTDFKSEAWRKKLQDEVFLKALATQNLVTASVPKLKGKNKELLKKCVEMLNEAVKLIKQNDYDTASNDLLNCYDSLEGDGTPLGSAGDFIPNVRVLADDASTACNIANDIIT